MVINRLMKLTEVLHTTGLGRSTLYVLISENKFPKQVQLTQRSVAWPQDEVQNWVLERIEERDKSNTQANYNQSQTPRLSPGFKLN
ncbi:phage transcriptional regulator AlpA [Catenovulum agarivorans DS-2]|uniref:Phage transcriptional regulator AlpA n=1 Tax=Catenovulum agarivorans DS-2 TaxID=1328313 RepID=W7QLN3_9ALTE|nr:AlpA family transcriptional regulator [Catenovulum agarivorans]EWH09033.1 phage transcriptional regulator AlpA [Catenovulum agarivorans DS-2]